MLILLNKHFHNIGGQIKKSIRFKSPLNGDMISMPAELIWTFRIRVGIRFEIKHNKFSVIQFENCKSQTASAQTSHLNEIYGYSLSTLPYERKKGSNYFRLSALIAHRLYLSRAADNANSRLIIWWIWSIAKTVSILSLDG